MATPRKGTFAFDLSKPVKRGSLLKQGALHKAFKAREFVLYPGFLVYYDSESKWRLDLAKGETLGGRLGAVKLKKATVSIARNAPKACKYGLMVNAPDPANKRQTYLMNASSKEDRDQWIEAIGKAIPVSPHMQRKDIKPTREDAEKPTSSTSSDSVPTVPEKDVKAPLYTQRQDTACDAALEAASCTDSNKEQKAINEMITSVNSSITSASSSLKDTNPAFMTRHDTATMAALELSHDTGESRGEGHHNGLGEVEEEEEEHETNIDSIFGKQEESSEDENSSGISSTSTPTHLMSPEPTDATEMPTTENVKSEESTTGAVVTTTVKVDCSPMSSPVPIKRVRECDQDSCSSSPSLSDRPRTCSSTQILLNDVDQNVTLSVNLNGYDSDDTLSDEESHPDLLTLQDEDFKKTTETLKAKQEGSEEFKGEPPIKYAEKKEENEVSEASKPSPSASPSASPSTSPSRSPVIGIKEDRSGKGSVSSKGSHSSDEMSRLSPPTDKKRSNSVPFIEKKGYLYKMGGQRKTWKLRYFILRPGVFYYFKDSRNITKPIGEVKLKNLSVFFPGIGERKQSFQFTVHTESTWNKRANWVFAGQSEREMKEWITAFKAAGQKLANLSPHDSDSG